MNIRIDGLLLLCFGLVMLVKACRSYEDPPWWNFVPDEGGEQQGWHDAGEPPNTLKDPPRLFEQNPVIVSSMAQPPSDPVQEYATHVFLNAGCVINPDEAAVTKSHDDPALCEHLVAIAAHNIDGDFYEIDAPFTWGVVDPQIVDTPCLYTANDGFCFAQGKQDIFDMDGLHEPATSVMACAVNSCPTPRPQDCQDMVCASVIVASVVSLEGDWLLSGSVFSTGAFAQLVQDGRTFHDPALGVKHGAISGTQVTFKVDDLLFQGTISSNRNHMEGNAWDQMDGTALGAWSADRLTAP